MQQQAAFPTRNQVHKPGITWPCLSLGLLATLSRLRHQPDGCHTSLGCCDRLDRQPGRPATVVYVQRRGPGRRLLVCRPT